MQAELIEQAVTWAMVKLTRTFPGSFPDPETASEKRAMYRELLTAHSGISAESWKAGVMAICWTHPGDFLPPPARFIDACREEALRLDRDRVKALPAPERPATAPDPAAYARNIAIGKARQRKRIACINAYRATLPPGVWKYGGEQSHHWRGKDTPTEAEIDAVLREMHTSGQINADTLAKAIALHVPINILQVEWMGSAIAVGVPGEASPASTDAPVGYSVPVRWADGVETRPTVMDAEHARRAQHWLRTHTPETAAGAEVDVEPAPVAAAGPSWPGATA